LVLDDPSKTSVHTWPIHVQTLLSGLPLPPTLSKKIKSAIEVQKKYFLLKNGVLLRKVKVNSHELTVPYVPVHLRHTLMSKIHETLGHLRSPSIIEALSLEGWWPTMIKDLKIVESNCEVCKKYDSKGSPFVHPMHPLPVPSMPCHTWHIDWMQDLPLTQDGNQNLLVAPILLQAFTKPHNGARKIIQIWCPVLFLENNRIFS
jgi:hypothetical protein